MFDQNDGQQTQDNQNDFGQPLDTSIFSGAPAPGAPAGPITDHSGASTQVAFTPTTEPQEDTAPSAPEPSTSGPIDGDELLGIKQDALQELTPLVGHLEQSAEEKFKTTMMMIQATDDHSLVKSAYDSAKQITDEKARAQALLDVVNEINYFTQQHNNQS